MEKEHQYNLSVKWTGNNGSGTSGYDSYSRNHLISSGGKTEIQCSSDPAFRGDPTKYNPEELLVASIAACHMLWYLHLCAQAKVVVVDYSDNAVGIMAETPAGGGSFKLVTLNPKVIVGEDSMIDKAMELHKRANELCFIANSLNFPVHHRAECKSV